MRRRRENEIAFEVREGVVTLQPDVDDITLRVFTVGVKQWDRAR